MIFVTGPLYAGKQEYIMRALGWTEEDFAAKAVRDVQKKAADAAREAHRRAEQQPDAAREAHRRAEQQADAAREAHRRAEQEILQELLGQLADCFAQKEVVIATEVGGGVVPADPAQRREREAAGRLACMMAERAQTVIRVCCGLPQVLKG